MLAKGAVMPSRWGVFLAGICLCLAVSLIACSKKDAAPVDAGLAQAQSDGDDGCSTTDADLVEVVAKEPLPPPTRPGLKGPFVEPPLEQRPELIAHVVVAEADQPEALLVYYDTLRAWLKTPIGYPAVDQTHEMNQANKAWALVAGKFARRAWAEDLAAALKASGYSARVLYRRYLHDRFRPAPLRAGWPKAGRIFAGVSGGSVPLLNAPDKTASGAGQALVDGQVVRVLEEVWRSGRRWFRVHGGYLSARRLILDGNVFPGPFGRRAVLGVPLGCKGGQCRWDYWLVGRDFNPRRLLKPGGERMPHAFSPEGRWLAYSDFEPRLWVVAADGTTLHDLGPGTSPSWGPGGHKLFYRGPGIKKQDDNVYVADARPLAEGKAPAPAKVLYALKGTPYYPKAMATIPPQVDWVDGGPHMFTLFFRAVEKKGKVEIQRWGVIFTVDGLVIDKKGVQIAN